MGDKLFEQRVAGQVVAQDGDKQLDGDFGALEELRPGEAGGGGQFAEAACGPQPFGVHLAGV